MCASGVHDAKQIEKMLFSWLRRSFLLILHLNLPPQKQPASLAEKDNNTHGGLETSQKSSHTAHGLAGSASPSPCLCDVHVCRCVIHVRFVVSLELLYLWRFIRAECGWMWLTRIVPGFQSHLWLFCVHAQQVVRGHMCVCVLFSFYFKEASLNDSRLKRIKETAQRFSKY